MFDSRRLCQSSQEAPGRHHGGDLRDLRGGQRHRKRGPEGRRRTGPGRHGQRGDPGEIVGGLR